MAETKVDWSGKLRDVSWGYRKKFSRILKRIDRNSVMEGEVGARSIHLLKDSLGKILREGSASDVVLNELLTTLDEGVMWMINSPDLLERWLELGLDLLVEEWGLSRRYFRAWRRVELTTGDFEGLEFLLDHFRLLQERTEPELALSFLNSYSRLKEELDKEDVIRFLEAGTRIYGENPETAARFLSLKLDSAHKKLEDLRDSCHLDSFGTRLERLLKGVSGKPLSVSDLADLDSDELLGRGARLLFLADGVYLPEKIDLRSDRDENGRHLLTVGYIAGCAYLFQGFPHLHGSPGWSDCGEALKKFGLTDSPFYRSLFFIADLERIFAQAISHFPALRFRLKEAVRGEYERRPLGSVDEPPLLGELLYRSLSDESLSASREGKGGEGSERMAEMVSFLKRTAGEGRDFMEVGQWLPRIGEKFVQLFGGKEQREVRRLSFFTDYGFHAVPSSPGAEKVKLTKNGDREEREGEESPRNADRIEEKVLSKEKTGVDDREGEKEEGERQEAGAYFYDEWDNEAEDYLHDWCRLREVRMEEVPDRAPPPAWGEELKKVKRTFERLKPDRFQQEKHLLDGDKLVLDEVVRHEVERRALPRPYQRVYAKDFPNLRDIATAILVDVSGSTNEQLEGGEVLELEKKASLLLGEGLHRLGDRFGLFGFSGNGRKNCRFFIYKDLSESWSDLIRSRIMAARPGNSTRMGVAIRHTLSKLKAIDARRKLLLLITDGKPQDGDGYSPETLYAQKDVRKACIECLRENVAPFALVIGREGQGDGDGDLRMTFLENHFVPIENLNRLPQALIDSYLNLTVR